MKVYARELGSRLIRNLHRERERWSRLSLKRDAERKNLMMLS